MSILNRLSRQLNADFRTPPSFKRVARVEEHFNPHQFVVPGPQRTMAEARTKRDEVEAFVAFVRDRVDQAAEKLQAAGAHLEKNVTPRGSLRAGAGLGPMMNAHAAQWAGLLDEGDRGRRRAMLFQEDLARFEAEVAAIWGNAEAKVAALRAQHVRDWQGGGGGGRVHESPAAVAAQQALCAAERQIMEDAVPAIGRRYEEFVGAVIGRERVAINEELSYLPFRTGGAAYHFEFYTKVIEYLRRVAVVAGANPIRTYTCGTIPGPGGFDEATGDLPNPRNCPLNLTAKWRVVKITATCATLSLEFEAGLKFAAKKNFESGETTLKAGVGVDAGFEGWASVEGSGGLVVVWDRGNSLSFVGVETTSSASLSGIPGLTASGDLEEGVNVSSKVVSGTADVVSVNQETTLGVTLGPRGAEASLRGNAGIDVLGRDLVGVALR